ncbi:MAG: pirin family protein [Bacteroidetes bacterium]|nr:pirin family protein [Bacteroidota bacterium]
MTTRTVAQIETATIEIVGVNRVKRALPTRNLKQVDPFLFIDHLIPTEVAPGADVRIPPHPHAGFEVVTYLLDGEFFHRDSRGHDQIATGGDVNWMTSGSGIIHSEGPTEEFLKTGGKLQLMQVWINLPAKEKNIEPTFRHYTSSVLPVVDNGDAWLKILIGDYGGRISPIRTHTPMFYYHVKLKKDKLFVLPVNELFSAAIYVMQGKIRVLNEEAKTGQLVDFNIDGDQLAFAALEDTDLIVFGGLPIKEKVVSYGPFVMNNFEEIQKAIANYETGKMGILEY